MPIRKNGKTRSGGVRYCSPLGKTDSSFEDLPATAQHYVALYGVRIRDFILGNYEVGAFVRATDVRNRMEAAGGLRAQYGDKTLGPDSVRLAVHATLRWMTLRKDLTESMNGSRDGRMLAPRSAEHKLDHALDYYGYKRVESENAPVG